MSVPFSFGRFFSFSLLCGSRNSDPDDTPVPSRLFFLPLDSTCLHLYREKCSALPCLVDFKYA